MKKDTTPVEEQNVYGIPDVKIKLDLETLTAFVLELSKRLDKIEPELSRLNRVNLT